MQLKLKNILIIFLNIFFITLFIIFKPGFLISMIFLVWINLMIYSLLNLKCRISLFAFGFCFFNFLLGRQFLEKFFSYKVEDFSKKTNIHAELAILISLITIFIFYIFFSKENRNNIDKTDNINTTRTNIIRDISKKLFYLSNSFGIINALIKSYLAINNGYYSTFTGDGISIQQNNIIIYVFDKFEQMLPIFVAIFFATLPKKKQCKKIILFYLIYLILTIFTGHRSNFIVGILWIIVYLVYRENNSEEIWIEKKYLVAACLSFPLFIILLGVVGQLRIGLNVKNFNVFKIFIDFFYDQGVSINVIKRSYNLSELLNSDRYYSLSFIPESIIGRMLGFKQYVGNTVEHAQKGYNLSHALSYALMGNKYLNGVGTGTSYIAELNHDFGYVGVFFGNILYAWLLAMFNRVKAKKIYFKAAIFLIMRQLLWSPRGNFSDVFLILLQPFPILAVLFTYIVYSAAIKKFKLKKLYRYD